jgi:hypothetical protein
MHAVKRRKASESGHILRRNCLLEDAIERKKGTGRLGGRRKQLVGDFKEKRRYRNFKQKTMDRTVCKICFGRGYGPVARQTTQ